MGFGRKHFSEYLSQVHGDEPISRSNALAYLYTGYRMSLNEENQEYTGVSLRPVLQDRTCSIDCHGQWFFELALEDMIKGVENPWNCTGFVTLCCVGASSPTGDGVLGAPLLSGGGGAPPPANADAVLADAKAWANFLEESNSFIQWMLSTMFLFIPAQVIFSLAKLLDAIWSQAPVSSTEITDLLSEVKEKALFP
ncbi:hypothetical protein Bca52824_037379 [Brassica carinata]|uniref:Uncharacterized protein n=1 Tax=Brassica carinata TaxID=52824 RepID=A0A8X7S6S3_BRACI|nr:hypothetical protein Bca52824_037379 [Brassica carinata]